MQNKVDVKRLRSFGLIVGGLFGVVGLWRTVIYGEELRLWALFLAVFLVGAALFVPKSLRHVYRGWMAIGEILGWINTRIILSIIFYGIFMPVGLIKRLFSTDAMRRQFESEAETYRVVRKPRPTVHMIRQF